MLTLQPVKRGVGCSWPDAPQENLVLLHRAFSGVQGEVEVVGGRWNVLWQARSAGHGQTVSSRGVAGGGKRETPLRVTLLKAQSCLLRCPRTRSGGDVGAAHGCVPVWWGWKGAREGKSEHQ